MKCDNHIRKNDKYCEKCNKATRISLETAVYISKIDVKDNEDLQFDVVFGMLDSFDQLYINKNTPEFIKPWLKMRFRPDIINNRATEFVKSYENEDGYFVVSGDSRSSE